MNFLSTSLLARGFGRPGETSGAAGHGTRSDPPGPGGGPGGGGGRGWRRCRADAAGCADESGRAAVEPLEGRRLLSADLAVAFAGAFPTRVDPGPGHEVVAVRVGNRGDAAAAGAAVTLYASADGTLDAADVPLATATRRKPIRAGKAVTLRVPLDRPADLPDGNYQILARVAATPDGPGGTGGPGANPADNVAVGPAGVSFRAPFADLGAAVAWQPAGPVSTVGRGGRPPPAVTVGVDVFNAGNTTVKVPVGVTLYLSADGTLDGSDVAVATRTPGKPLKLVPGRAQTVALTFRLPADLVPGSYTLLAVVDPTNAVAEAQEGNNVAASADPVAVVDTPQGRPSRRHHEHHYHYFGYGGDVFLFEGYDAYGDYVDGGSVYVPPPPDAWTDPGPAGDPSTGPTTDPAPQDAPRDDPGADPSPNDGPSTQPGTQPSTGPTTQPSDGGGGGGDGSTGDGSDSSDGGSGGESGSAGSNSGGWDSGDWDSGGWDGGGWDSGGSDFGGSDFGGWE